MSYTVRIVFADPENAAVTISYDYSAFIGDSFSSEKVVDSFVFCCFLLRQLSNLGRSRYGIKLAEQLFFWSASSVIAANATANSMKDSKYIVRDSHMDLNVAISLGMNKNSAQKKI